MGSTTRYTSFTMPPFVPGARATDTPPFRDVLTKWKDQDCVAAAAAPIKNCVAAPAQNWVAPAKNRKHRTLKMKRSKLTLPRQSRPRGRGRNQVRELAAKMFTQM